MYFLNQDNQRNIYLDRHPICIIIYDLDFSFDHRERTQYWCNKILQVANKYKDKYTFAIADEDKMSQLLKNLVLKNQVKMLMSVVSMVMLRNIEWKMTKNLLRKVSKNLLIVY